MLRSFPAKITLSAFIMIFIGGLGGIVTASSIDSWYSTLNKPPGTPPNWLFGPVWTTLYLLIGIAFALIWHQHQAQLGKTRLTLFFALQLILNLAWTPVFFGARQITAALVVIFVCLVTFFYRKRTNTSIVTALATAAIVMTSSDATESDEETVLVSK